MAKNVMVSAQAWEYLKNFADEKLKDPALSLRWLEQCTTSKAAGEAGGLVDIQTDRDWPLLFVIWWQGGAVPRERV